MSWYAVKLELVRQSLQRIRAAKIHPHFNGYLCMMRTAAQLGRDYNLPAPSKAFFDEFWAVDGGPPRKPYLYPFIASEPTAENAWFNKNVAGSYAPSSLRENQPFLRVVEVVDGSYTLRPRHWELALRHFCYGEKVSAVDLVVLLYRDYGVRSDQQNLAGLVALYRTEFGLADDAQFEYLYQIDNDLVNYSDPFIETDALP